MKKIFYTLTTIAAIAMLFASCEKNAGPVPENSITIDFALDDVPETKTSSTASLNLNNGCTIAFYSQTSGNLLASGSCEGSTRKIVITSVPSENCNVYAVGNASFDWPSKETSVSTQGISIDVVQSEYIPRSTLPADYTWSVGTTYMKISDMPKMYSTIKIKRNQPSGYDFTATSAKVKNCPNIIYPFGGSSEGTSGTCDTATSSDIALFNDGDEFTLYVPSQGETQVELKGNRVNGSGINYEDTYTITVPALNREEEDSKIIKCNGQNSDDVIVVVIGTDTRSVTFGNTGSTAYSLAVNGDATNYSTIVKGVATNGEKGWNYTLSWDSTSNLSDLYGNTTVKINNTNIDLSGPGSVTLPGDGEFKNIIVNSTYSGNYSKTLTLTCPEKGSTLTITVSSAPAHTVTFSFNPQPYTYLSKQSISHSGTYYVNVSQNIYVWDDSNNKITNQTFVTFYNWVGNTFTEQKYAGANEPAGKAKDNRVKTVTASTKAKTIYVGLAKTYNSFTVFTATGSSSTPNVWPTTTSQQATSKVAPVSVSSGTSVSTSTSNPYGVSSSDWQAIYKYTVTSNFSVTVTKGQ